MPPYKPALDDKVTVGSSPTVWMVSAISHNGAEVTLHSPHSNLERFRIPIRDLTPVELAPRSAPAPPAKKGTIDTESINEALVVAQHESVQHLSAIIHKLKQQLAADGAPPKSAAILDKLCLTVDGAWDAAIGSITKMVER